MKGSPDQRFLGQNISKMRKFKLKDNILLSYFLFWGKKHQILKKKKSKKEPDFNQWYRYLISTVCILSIVSFKKKKKKTMLTISIFVLFYIF
jgi:hypothetical protein